MKITKIITLVFTIVLCVSCNPIKNSNVITNLQIEVYKDDKLLTGNTKTELAAFFLDELIIKVIPREIDLKIIEIPYYKFGKGEAYKGSGLMFPLRLNYEDSKYTRLQYEEFRLILNYKEKDIFNDVLRLHYVEGNPWEEVIKVYSLNSEERWELFSKKQYTIKTEDGKDTNFKFEVLIPNEYAFREEQRK